MRPATGMSKYDPPCACRLSVFRCAKHRRLRPGQALYLVAGEPARFGKPWSRWSFGAKG